MAEKEGQSDVQKWFDTLSPEKQKYHLNIRAQERIIDFASECFGKGIKPRYLDDLQEYLNHLWKPETNG